MQQNNDSIAVGYRYYEWFQSNGWSASIGMSIDNVMAEAAAGIPMMAHAYGRPENCSDPQVRIPEQHNPENLLHWLSKCV